MTDFPASGAISTQKSNAAQKALYEQLLGATKQIPGAGITEQVLTLSSGLITPAAGAGGIINVRGEAGADDILDKVVTTNLARGQMLWLFAGNPGAEDITVNHAAGGNDQIVLSDGVDFIMNATGMYLVLRYDGTDWEEMGRSWGDQSPNTTAFRTHFGLGTAATLNSGTSAGNVPLVSNVLGKHTIWVPASAMVAQTTSGCSEVQQVELVANRPELICRDFDGTSGEFAQFGIKLPKSWDEGVVQARFVYAVNANVSTTVRWTLAGICRGDNEGLAGAAFGTAQQVTDTYHGTANRVAITSFTPDITVLVASENELAVFQLGRDPDNDSTSQDARLIGAEITYTIDALNDD